MEKRRTNNHFNNISLTESYSEGIERFVGVKANFKDVNLPDKLIEKRKQYWSGLIQKYSELPDGEFVEIDPADQERKDIPGSFQMPQLCMRNCPSLIQYWINTGNHPCRLLKRENKYSDSGSSLSETELSNMLDVPIMNNVDERSGTGVSLTETEPSTPLHSSIIKPSNKHAIEVSRGRDSSSTSVDTVAYILSNTNVTKKAKTKTILEGAKHSTPVNTWKSYSRTTDPKNELFELDNKNLLLDNNGNCPPSPETVDSALGNGKAKSDRNMLTTDTSLSKSVTISMSTSLEKTVGTSDSQNDCRQPQENHLTISEEEAGRRLTRGVSNITKTISDTKRDLQSVGSVEQNSMADKSNTSSSPTTKLGRRKQLYSSRDSPVDLMHTQRRLEDKVSPSRRSSHPALDPTVAPSRCSAKSRKLFSKKKNGHFANVVADVHGLPVSEGNQTETDDTSKLGSADTGSGSESKKLNRKTKRGSKNNPVESQTSSSSNVSLRNNTRVSSGEFTSVNATEKTKSVGKRHSRNLTKVHVPNMNPVVRLTRLSKSEIEKYKRPADSIPSSKYSDSTVSLTRFSQLDVQSHEVDKRKIVPRTIRRETEIEKRLQINCSPISSLSSRIETVDSKDVDSTQSTLLICQCQNDDGVELCTSGSSVFTENSSQDIFNYSMGQTGTEEKSSDTDRKLNGSVLFETLLRTKRKTDKSEETEQLGKTEDSGRNKSGQRGALLSRRCLRSSGSSSGSSQKSAIFNRKLRNSKAAPIKTRNNTKYSNVQNNLFVDTERLNNKKLNVSPHSNKVGSVISDESELIVNRSSRRNVEACDTSHENYPLLNLSSDEDDNFIKLIQHSETKKRSQSRSKSDSTNAYTNYTIDEEDSVRGKRGIKSSGKTIFSTPYEGTGKRSLRISERNRFIAEQQHQGNNKNNSASQHLSDVSRNTSRKRILDLASSADESEATNSTSTIVAKNSKSSVTRRNVRRRGSAVINSTDDTVDRSKKRRTTVNTLSFQTRIFDSSSESASVSSLCS